MIYSKHMIRKRGFTLLETTMATLLVSLTLVASLQSMAFVLQSTSHEAEMDLASRLGQRILSEIVAKPFEDPTDSSANLGPNSGENVRNTWDDCDDYNGYSTNALTDLDGSTMANATGWSANVAVNYCLETNPSISSVSATRLKRILLTLTAPSGRTITMSSLRGADGLLQIAQPSGTTIRSAVEIRAIVGTRSLETGTRLHNQQEPN